MPKESYDPQKPSQLILFPNLEKLVDDSFCSTLEEIQKRFSHLEQRKVFALANSIGLLNLAGNKVSVGVIQSALDSAG